MSTALRSLCLTVLAAVMLLQPATVLRAEENGAASEATSAAAQGEAQAASGEGAAAPRPGRVLGKVVDESNGRGLEDVRVSIQDTDLATFTDFDGDYIFDEVPAGTYTITFLKLGYLYSRLEGVEVTAGEAESVSFVLPPRVEEEAAATTGAEGDPYAGDSEIIELGEYVVSAEERTSEDEAVLLSERKYSDSVSDAIGSDFMSLVGAGDAAAALTKVTGVSVEGGKYAYVRGMGDRYTSTSINNLPIPSADPDKRAVQFDLFPSEMIESIVVEKTYLPQLPGNFTSGNIRINTKSMPDDFVLGFSLSAEYNTESSFEDNFLSGDEGDRDWLGMDDGTRDIPDAVRGLGAGSLASAAIGRNYTGGKLPIADAQAIINATGAFSPRMQSARDDSLLNHGFSVKVGDRVKTSNGKPLGYLFSLAYDRDFFYSDDTIQNRFFNSSSPDPVTGAFPDPNQSAEYIEERGVETVSIGSIFTVGLQPSEDHELTFNAIISQTGEDEGLLRVGNSEVLGGSGDSVEGSIHYTERTLAAFQLRGEHVFGLGESLLVEWGITTATSVQDEPDLRLFAYKSNPYGFGTETRPDLPQRYWRRVEEDNLGFRLDFHQFLTLFDRPFELKFGGSFDDTDRRYNDRKYIYEVGALNTANGFFANNPDIGTSVLANGGTFTDFTRQNVTFINSNTPGATPGLEPVIPIVVGGPTEGLPLFYINQVLTGFYDGSNDIFAGYLTAEYQFMSKWRAIAGFRVEDTSFNVSGRATEDPGGGSLRSGFIDQTDILPMASLVYSPRDDMNIRFVVSQTLARPTFREQAPLRTRETIGDDFLNGNENLRISQIDNYDLRFEWFLSTTDLIAISFFHKEITDPIVRARSIASDRVTLRPENSEAGEISGVELELRKSLDFIHRWLDGFSLGTNFTYIESKVDLSDSQLSRIENFLDTDNDGILDFPIPNEAVDLPLIDQPEYIFNLGLFYTTLSGDFTASLVLNVVGERLRSIGLFPDPNVYELPTETLDLIISKRFGDHWTVKFSAKNLTDPDIEVAYDQEGDRLRTSYNRGRLFGISISYEN